MIRLFVPHYTTALLAARPATHVQRGVRLRMLAYALVLLGLPLSTVAQSNGFGTAQAASVGQKDGVIRLTILRESSSDDGSEVKLETIKTLDVKPHAGVDAEGRRTINLAGKLVYNLDAGGAYRIRLDNLSGHDLHLRIFDTDAEGGFAELTVDVFAGEVTGRLLHAGEHATTQTFHPEKQLANEGLIVIGSAGPLKLGLFMAGGATRGAMEVPDRIATAANISAFFGPAVDYDIAVELYERLLRLAVERGDEAEASKLRNLLALTYHSVSRYDKSAEYYEQALTTMRAVKDREGEAIVLSNLGLLYSTLNRNAEAIEKYRQALAIEREVRRPARETVTLHNLGIAYDATGKYPEAIAHYKQALALYRQQHNRTGIGKVLNGLGNAYRYACQQALAGGNAAKQAKSATKRALPTPCLQVVKMHEQALTIARAVQNKADEGFALGNLGSAYTVRGEYRQAIVYYQQALAIHREVGNRAAQGLVLNSLMFAWRGLGQPALAVINGKEAVNIYQEIRGEIKDLEQASRQSFLEAKTVTYRTLADLLIAAGRLPEAQQVLGMLKEEEYFEFVRRDGNEASSLTARSPLAPAEVELARRYQEIAGRLVAVGLERGALRDKVTLTPAEEKRLTQLDAELELGGQAFQQFLDQLAKELKGNATIFDLREAQGLMDTLRELAHGAVALYTVIGADKYRIILITPDVQKAAAYPITAAELNRKVAAFREVLQDPRRDPRPLARELYQIIVAPIAKDLQSAKAETLMWSLDGALRYVPIAALNDGQQYMVERYRNVVFTPASRDRLKDQPAAQWRGLGFGVSKAQTGFKSLPAVPEELHGIIRAETTEPAATAGVLPGKVLLDEDFTADTLKAALRQRYPLVHIASHFAFRPGNETDSFLLLGDGNHLSLAQLKATTNLFSGVELLTLSACDTASGSAGADGVRSKASRCWRSDKARRLSWPAFGPSPMKAHAG